MNESDESEPDSLESESRIGLDHRSTFDFRLHAADDVAILIGVLLQVNAAGGESDDI